MATSVVFHAPGFGEGDRSTRDDRDEREAYRRGPSDCELYNCAVFFFSSFRDSLSVFFAVGEKKSAAGAGPEFQPEFVSHR